MRKRLVFALLLSGLLPVNAYTEETRPPFQVPLGQRQLFIDDFGIAHIESLTRTPHQPVKKGAVVRPDQPWEYSLQTRCAPAWDPAVNRFKLWIITSTTIPGVGEMSYAESEDGITWSKPVLRQKALQGSFENNIVTLDPAREWGANAIENVVIDPDDPDPARRFKGFAHVYGREPIVSPDGIHWTKLDVPALPSQDESNLTYDPVARMFIATLKTTGPYGRSHAIWTSTDFEHWTDTGVLFHADEEDQTRGHRHMAERMADPALLNAEGLDPAECTVDVYNLGICRYEGLYLGFPAMFHQTPKTGFHLVQLASSRDLKTWERAGDRGTFIGPSTVDSGAYDLTQILPPTGPILHGDELWFYYTGITYRDPPEGAQDLGAICRAVLRRDGFISLDAGNETGTLLTEPFAAPAGNLYVNVNAAQGELRAEVLDEDGHVLAESAPVTGDQMDAKVLWETEETIAFVGKTVRLRFSLRNMAFYSYWFFERQTASTLLHRERECTPTGLEPRDSPRLDAD